MLLSEEDRGTWKSATAALRGKLKLRSKVLAAQDFRHNRQKEKESVADFIYHMEKEFHIAYKNDTLSWDTREAFLYGQLQDGLHPELMYNPSVSGALTYQELCMAARNEEKRQAELQKRRMYRPEAIGRDQQVNSQPPRSINRQQPSKQLTLNTSMGKQCYNCGKLGHLAKDCRKRSMESKASNTGRTSTPGRNPVNRHVSTSNATNEDDSVDSSGVFVL